MLTFVNFKNKKTTSNPIFAEIKNRYIVKLLGYDDQIKDFYGALVGSENHQGKITTKDFNIFSSGYFIRKNSHLLSLELPYQEMSVSEYLNFYCSLYSNARNTDAAISFMGIERIENIKIKELDEANKYFVQISQLLCFPKKIWLLDDYQRFNNKFLTKKIENLISVHIEQGGIIFCPARTELQIGADFFEVQLHL